MRAYVRGEMRSDEGALALWQVEKVSSTRPHPRLRWKFLATEPLFSLSLLRLSRLHVEA